MAFFNMFNSNSNNNNKENKKEFNTNNLDTFDIKRDYDIPTQRFYKSNNGYLWGKNGMFPQELDSLYTNSPLHSAIINYKSLLTTGEGLEMVNDENLSMSEKISAHQLFVQLKDLEKETSMDLHMHNRVCLKITWNKEHTKILKIERLNPSSVRIFELNNEMQATKYIYNFDWENLVMRSIKYDAYDPLNKSSSVQILEYQNTSPGKKLYVEPTYISSIAWIGMDSEMSIYHKSNIQNSLNPSMLIKQYERPGSPEEQREVLRQLNDSFAGAKNTSRVMVVYSDGKELSPDIIQMESNKLDSTFLQLTDTIQRQICYSHNIDPQLLGLKTPGSLGDSGNMEYAFGILNQLIIKPSKLTIERIFNKLLLQNKLGVQVKFSDIEINIPATGSKFSNDEVDEVDIQMSEDGSHMNNENLKNLTGRQSQNMLIIRQYKTEKLTLEQASMMLKSSLGFSDEEINIILK